MSGKKRAGVILVTMALVVLVRVAIAQNRMHDLRAGDVDDRKGIVTVRSTGRPLDGTVVYLSTDGKKERTIDYVKGKREGYVRIFSGEGKELVRERWREGIQHGLVEEFFPSGRIYKERNFIIGQMTGQYSVYDESGQLRIAGSYVEGKKTGRWRVFSSDGELVEMVTFWGGVLKSEVVSSEDVAKPNKAPEPTPGSVTPRATESKSK